MNTNELELRYGLSGWLEVGRYILGQCEISDGILPQGTVVFILRSPAVPAERNTVQSDILYIGYSTKLKTLQTGRLYNIRRNHQPTNARIREGTRQIYQQGDRVELGWYRVNNKEEALRLVRELRYAYRRQHGTFPPWDGR